MQIKILCPLWGFENYKLEDALKKISDAGYDGVDTWLPEDQGQSQYLLDYLEKHELILVAHQHQAAGKTFEAFKTSFLHYLKICAEAKPLLINSHTGRDYFSFEENLELIDIAQSFSKSNNIRVAHETHRGRFAYSPGVTKEYFAGNKDFQITADFSHWVCVTESFLENFSEIMQEAIDRTRHIHARIGYVEGPQVPDPRAPEWQQAVDYHLHWWDKIVAQRKQAGDEILTFTTEFGPPPYLPTMPFSNKAVADQFEINCYMKDLLKERYGN